MNFSESVLRAVKELPQDLNEDQKTVACNMSGGGFVYRSAWITGEGGKKRRGVLVKCATCQREMEACVVPELAGVETAEGCLTKMWRTSTPMLCPNCGDTGPAVHISNVCDTFPINQRFFMTMENSGGYFVLLNWFVQKLMTKDAKIVFSATRSEGVLLDGNNLYRIASTENGFFYSSYCEWRLRKKFADYIGTVDPKNVYVNKDAVNFSNAEKSGFLEYINANKRKTHIRPVIFLKLWTKFPTIENLVKCGLGNFVNRLVYASCSTNGYYCSYETFSDESARKILNRKKVKPHEMLGVEKNRLKEVNGMSPAQFFLWREALKFDRNPIVGEINWYQLDSLSKSAPDGNLYKAYKYCKKNHDSDYTLFADYERMLKIIYGEVPRELWYPKDLKKEHDRIQLLLKHKKDEILDKRIREQSEKKKILEFSDAETGLTIRPAASHEELIQEGKLLHHCVATYSEDCAYGRTTILFIRRISEPENPYFTLEFKNGKIVQDRGDHNCDRTPEIYTFEKKWLAYISSLNGGNENERNRTKRIS